MQLEAVRKDSVRLQSENSQLHVLVMQQAERQERQAREHYQASKRLEDTIADLSYWKNVAAEKLVVADRENGALRRRCEELQQLINNLSAGRRQQTWHCGPHTCRRPHKWACSDC